MTLFTIDEAKCALCEVCVAACPAGLVAVTADSSVPVYVDCGEGACFDCGHCVAPCPTGAFAHEHATADDCLPIRDGLEISAEQITQLMRGRRSVRNFTDEPVPRESLAELLDVARYAPSGCNAQPVQWLVDTTANTRRPLRDFLELPRGHVVLASMAIGNPAFQYARIPPRKELQITWR